METLEVKTKTPITCETCLYMATHENCDGCLHGGKPYPWPDKYEYANWREGNWMGRIKWFELTGKRSIVIGGQGEAEVNAKGDPKKTAKHLHYVACQCGYMVTRLSRQRNGEQTLYITTPEGYFRLVWDSDGLKAIERWNYSHDWDTNKDTSTFVSNYWSRADVMATLASLDGAKDEIMREYKD